MLLLLFACLFALPFPRRARDWAGAFGAGMAVYFALLIAAGAAALLLHMPQLLPMLPYLAVPAALIGWLRRRREWRTWLAASAGETRLRALIAGAAVAVLACCERATALPMGWDSAFHALLAQKIVFSGEWPQNWLPFTAIPLNYPPGTHILLAEIAAGFRLPVPLAERQLQFALMVPAVLLAGSIAARAFCSAAAGWFAGLGLAFWGELGTAISFRAWGGYPTALGFLFFFALCRFALAGGVGGRGWIGAVLCWGGLGLSHHLTAVIAGLIVTAFAVQAPWGRRRAERRVLARLLLSGLAAVLCFLPAEAAMLRAAGDFHSVNAFNFSEEPLFGWRELLTFSGALLPAGLVGLWCARRCRTPGARLLFGWLAVMAAVFVIDEYPYRLWCSRRIWGIESTVFPASRFLTAMALPLAAYAGSAAARAVRDRRIAALALTLLLAIGGVVRYGRAFLGERQFDIAAVAARINETVPENAYLVVDLPHAGNSGWLAYLTWRPGTMTPIPASENRRIGCFGAAIFSLPDSPRAMEVRRAFVEVQNLEAWRVAERDGEIVIGPYSYQSR